MNSAHNLKTVGMTSKDVIILRSLLGLFRNSLNSEWTIDANGPPVAELVDIDTDEGLGQWLRRDEGSLRVAVTSAQSAQGTWMIQRPWHRPGPFSLITTLNSLHEEIIKRAARYPLRDQPTYETITIPGRPERAAPVLAAAAVPAVRPVNAAVKAGLLGKVLSAMRMRQG